MAQYNQLSWVGIKPTVATAEKGGTPVTVGTISTTILAANDDRTSFYVENIGSNTVYVYLGSPATLARLALSPGDYIVCDDYTGIVTGIVAAGTEDVFVIEV